MAANTSLLLLDFFISLHSLKSVTAQLTAEDWLQLKFYPFLKDD